MYFAILDRIPLWALLLGTIALTTIAIECGYRVGLWRRSKGNPEKESPVTAVTSSTLGLLAFILAITVGIGVSRFDARREALLGEVNAISSAYLLADLLPAREQELLKAELREYVDVRLTAVETKAVIAGIRRSEELHHQMWIHAIEASRSLEGSVNAALFLHALNDVFDLHTRRVVEGLQSRIPPVIWIVLYGVALIGMSQLGYQTAIAGSTRSPATAGLVVAFAVILVVLVDLDRPQEGLLRTSQGMMRDLQEEMRR